jgi:ABC-type Na+ transport system ATPase subunit NatA
MISFSNINKQYGKQLLFVDASFQLNPGERVGLVGPNGAGKTTGGEDTSVALRIDIPIAATCTIFSSSLYVLRCGGSMAVVGLRRTLMLLDLHRGFLESLPCR